jgi:hypothetical protein
MHGRTIHDVIVGARDEAFMMSATEENIVDSEEEKIEISLKYCSKFAKLLNFE